VDTRVGSVENNDASLIEPKADAQECRRQAAEMQAAGR
jgi:hypothetical protein